MAYVGKMAARFIRRKSSLLVCPVKSCPLPKIVDSILAFVWKTEAWRFFFFSI